MTALELKSKEYCHYVRLVDGAQEVVELDITKADPFLESKPRHTNVVYARCRSAVIGNIYSSYIIYIDWCAECLRDAKVMDNTAEI